MKLMRTLYLVDAIVNIMYVWHMSQHETLARHINNETFPLITFKSSEPLRPTSSAVVWQKFILARVIDIFLFYYRQHFVPLFRILCN